MDGHNEAVTLLSEKVKEFYNQKKPFRIYHGSTNTTRRTKRPPDSSIDISGLNKVLSIRTDNMTALVEPNVPMDALVAETLKQGLIPPVVMEFPGITAGGAFAGTGGESSSFRWGTFDRTVQGVEIILGDGEIVWASEDERCDLLDGSAGAFGTLGVVTLLEVQLVRAGSRLVRLQYFPVRSAADAANRFREHCGPGSDYRWDYVDGIMFNNRCGVVIAGRLLPADAEDYDVTARYSRATDNWYYSDVQAKLKARPGGWADVVPLEDYLFRYDRGAFWCARHSFDYLGLPFNGLTRWLLDGLMHTRQLFSMLHATGAALRSVIQDLCVPARNLDVLVSFAELEFGLWPLWLCPMRPNAGRGIFQLSPAGDGVREDLTDDLWVNVGMWGRAPFRSVREAVEANRCLEEVVRAIGGYKWLYAQTFYSEDEFWSIYGKEEYDSLRAKYNATHLPDAYEKVRTEIDISEAQGRAMGGGWKSVWPFEAIIAFCGAVIGFMRH